MADLNDFFAKKDKKKQKAKYTTINDIDQKLKQISVKKEKVEIELPDEEWNVFEEKKVDYSGLKILDVNLEEEDTEENAKEDEAQCPWNKMTQESEEVEEGKQVKETKSWKTIEAPPPEEEKKPTLILNAYVPPHLRNSKITTKRASAPSYEHKRQENTTTNAYVPPHLRNKQVNTSHASSLPPNHRNKQIPANKLEKTEEMFPSLPAIKPK